MRPDAVAVVVTCYNLGRTIQEAIESVLRQTRQAAELLIVDDGSDDLYTLQALAEIGRAGQKVVRTANLGVSAARNTGIRLTSAPRVVILDGDDVLAPRYLEKLGARLDQDPTLDFVSCAQQGFGASSYVWCPPEPRIPGSMIRGVVHASSMFRRDVWETVGGFDETVRRNEVLDFWTTVLEHGFRGDVMDEPLLRYRVRQNSQYHTTITPEGTDACMRAFYRKHWHTVAANAEEMFVGKEAFLLEQHAHQVHVLAEVNQAKAEVAELRSEIARLHAEFEGQGRQAMDMGELRRTSPFSRTWGVDRGTPLDRAYIESFLDRHREDVRGRVLEIKDPGYTRLFGGDRVTQSDVLDIDVKNERATIHADLCCVDVIQADTYDAFVLTQTLCLVYDVTSTLRHAFRILKPGGVLLCTVPAAGRISHEGNGPDGDFWRFTEASLRRLFAEAFPIESFEITGFGNVLACTAFLYGLAAHELAADELQVVDPALPLVYGVRAVKPLRVRDGRARPSTSEARSDTEPENISHTTALRPTGRAVILAYHRVSADGSQVPLVMATDLFRAQMAFVRDRCRPISLEELADAAHSRRLPARAVAVTFDDGYLDCLREAAPVLVEYSIPATAFVTNQGGEDSPEFYWDLLDRVFAPGRPLPPVLEIPAAGVNRLTIATETGREDARRLLNERFYAMSGRARVVLAVQLREWSGISHSHEKLRPLTEDEIRSLSAMPGLTIGAHGRHHVCLPLQDRDTQRQEVMHNKRWLEGIVGRDVTAFAFPYGERDSRTLGVIRESNFTIGVTVDGLAVENGWPRLLLPRCEVNTTDVLAFASWLDDLLAGR